MLQNGNHSTFQLNRVYLVYDTSQGVFCSFLQTYTTPFLCASATYEHLSPYLTSFLLNSYSHSGVLLLFPLITEVFRQDP